jgi:hypothetical protein
MARAYLGIIAWVAMTIGAAWLLGVPLTWRVLALFAIMSLLAHLIDSIVERKI